MNKNKLVFRFVSVSFSILVILLVLIGFIKIGTYCYEFGYRVFTEEAVDAEPGRDVVVQITDGMSGMDIAKELESKGLVRDAKLFYVQLRVSAYYKKLNLGVYTLNTSMDARDMMVVMAAKKEDTTDSSSQETNISETEQTTEGTETTGSADGTGEQN